MSKGIAVKLSLEYATQYMGKDRRQSSKKERKEAN